MTDTIQNYFKLFQRRRWNSIYVVFFLNNISINDYFKTDIIDNDICNNGNVSIKRIDILFVHIKIEN